MVHHCCEQDMATAEVVRQKEEEDKRAVEAEKQRKEEEERRIQREKEEVAGRARREAAARQAMAEEEQYMRNYLVRTRRTGRGRARIDDGWTSR